MHFRRLLAAVLVTLALFFTVSQTAPAFAQKLKPGAKKPTKLPPLKLSPHEIKRGDGKTFTLHLADGYDIAIAREGMKRIRFMAMSPDKRLFLTDMHDRSDNKLGIVYILEDFDPVTRKFRKSTKWLDHLHNPNSVAFYTDKTGQHWLYLALTQKLLRYKYTAGETKPGSEPETLATFPDYGLNYKYGGWHLTRTIAIGGNGKIYVSVGSSCNACEEAEPVRATVMEMDPDGKNQRIFASGLRNAVGLEWINGQLYATNMGSDQFGDFKPDDTFCIVKENANYGWPYYYVDKGKLLADSKFARSPKRPPIGKVAAPYISLQSHCSPLGFSFIEKNDPWADVRDSFLIAMHGSGFMHVGKGYSVVRIQKGAPQQDFLNGFLSANKKTIFGRPVDIMKYADGFLLTDDYGGVLYYIFPVKRAV